MENECNTSKTVNIWFASVTKEIFSHLKSLISFYFLLYSQTVNSESVNQSYSFIKEIVETMSSNFDIIFCLKYILVGNR